MNELEHIEIVTSLIQEKSKRQIDVSANIPFEELGMDGMDIVDVLVEVERKLNVTFADHTLLRFTCVQDIIDAIDVMGG